MTTQIKEIIAETRRLEKEATPAEWRMAPKHCIYAQITSDADDIVTIGDSQSICMADAEFAIFTRNNITAILDYIKKLEIENEELKKTIIISFENGNTLEGK